MYRAVQHVDTLANGVRERGRLIGVDLCARLEYGKRIPPVLVLHWGWYLMYCTLCNPEVPDGGVQALFAQYL